MEAALKISRILAKFRGFLHLVAKNRQNVDDSIRFTHHYLRPEASRFCFPETFHLPGKTAPAEAQSHSERDATGRMNGIFHRSQIRPGDCTLYSSPSAFTHNSRLSLTYPAVPPPLPCRQGEAARISTSAHWNEFKTSPE